MLRHAPRPAAHFCRVRFGIGMQWHWHVENREHRSHQAGVERGKGWTFAENKATPLVGVSGHPAATVGAMVGELGRGYIGSDRHGRWPLEADQQNKR